MIREGNDNDLQNALILAQCHESKFFSRVSQVEHSVGFVSRVALIER